MSPAVSHGSDPDRLVADRFADVSAEILSRTPESDVDPSLERIRALVDLLGDPQLGYPVVHLTGTNGKTSTTRMVESLLRTAGLRTGRYTSPHVESITERIAVDGQPLDAVGFLRAYDEIAGQLALVEAEPGARRLSFFEVLTAMAFAAFAGAPVGAAAVEVGMGGTWDATNVVDAGVAVITPVAIDHTRFLGSTLEAIATEKAGIIKSGAVAVVAHQEPVVDVVLDEQVRHVGARAVREGSEFEVLARRIAHGGQLVTLRGLAGRYDDVFLPLHGAYQASNAAAAVAAVEALVGGGSGVQLDPEVVRTAFATVSSPGRLEVVARHPTMLLDAAHNPHGAAALAAAIRDEFTFSRLVGVLGVMADKDAAGILAALEPVLSALVVTAADSPRSMPAVELAGLARARFGAERVLQVDGVGAAVDEAVAMLGAPPLAGSGVLVTGSVVTVGQARSRLFHATCGPGG
ncbi:MAG: bifunctional folylpolyglutamate synthase/dihydrofolate synthase [Actinomycetes bacterium]